jgi:hypothetical protein
LSINIYLEKAEAGGLTDDSSRELLSTLSDGQLDDLTHFLAVRDLEREEEGQSDPL